jgi:predicted unusual protein kinase regulating ubiquinone biosynthesis (AarF/ABC1/UbiB family)
VPEEYCETFEPMCMKAPTTSYEEVESIIQEEHGKPISELFK